MRFDERDPAAGASVPRGGRIFYIAGHGSDRELLRAFSAELREAEEGRAAVVVGEEQEGDPWRLRRALRRSTAVLVLVTERMLTVPSDALEDTLKLAEELKVPVWPVLTQPELAALCRDAFGPGRALDRWEADLPVLFRWRLEDCERPSLPSAGREDPFSLKLYVQGGRADPSHAERLRAGFRSYSDTRDVALWFEEDLDSAGRRERMLRADAVLRFGPSSGPLPSDRPPLFTSTGEEEDASALHRAVAIERERLGRPFLPVTGDRRLFLADAFALGRQTEKDRALAAALWEEAAREGDPWAMARLGMEEHGQADAWLEKALPLLTQSLYGISARAPEAQAAGEILAAAADRAWSVCLSDRRFGEAEAALEAKKDAIDYLRRTGARSARFHMGAVYEQTGDIRLREGRRGEAEGCYRRAEEIWENVGRARRSDLTPIRYAALLIKIAALYTEVWRREGGYEALDLAVSYHERALAACGALNQSRRFRFWQHTLDLARSLSALAEEGDPDAEGIYEELSGFLGELRQGVSRPEIDCLYALSLTRWAMARRGGGDRQPLYEAHHVFKDLTDHFPDSREYARYLDHVTLCLNLWPRLPRERI